MKTIIYATLVALALPATASASSGVITGHVMFYQNQGNYCDVATQNCAGRGTCPRSAEPISRCGTPSSP